MPELDDDRWEEFRHVDIMRTHPSYQKKKPLAKLICERILVIRPYIQQAADYMYEGETRSRLRTEVSIFLYDEKAEHEKMKEYWDGRHETFQETQKKFIDPLSMYYIMLSFLDIRGQVSVSTPDRLRYLRISLHANLFEVPVGNIYMDLERYEVGT